MLKLDPDDSDADEDKPKALIKIDGEASSQQNTNHDLDNISSVHVNNSTPAVPLPNKVRIFLMTFLQNILLQNVQLLYHAVKYSFSLLAG